MASAFCPSTLNMKTFSKLVLALLCCCSTSLLLQAQQNTQSQAHSNHHHGIDHECASEPSPSAMRYLDQTARERQSARDMGRTGTIYIPVRHIIVRTSTGTGGISEATLQDEMDKLNAAYAPADVQFYECSRAYVNNDTYYNFDRADEAAFAPTYEVSNVVNIFFCNSVTSGGSSICGYADFPGDGDRIFMSNGCVGTIGGNVQSTFIHEFGHYFSLYHTHQDYNSPTLTNRERVDGSNCTTKGDRICDTPADPRLGSSNVNSSCLYTGTATDPNGDTYAPNPRNVMSYSLKQCRDFFSAGQIARIRYSAINDRSYLTCSCFSYDYVGAFNLGTTTSGSNYSTSGEVSTTTVYNCDADANQLRVGGCSDGTGSVTVDFDVPVGTDKLRIALRGGWQNGTSEIHIDGAFQKTFQLSSTSCAYTYIYVYNISNFTQDGQVSISLVDPTIGCAGDFNVDYMDVYAARCHQSGYAKLPYFTNFNSGILDDYWLLQSNNEFGRARLTNLHGPYSGAYHLVMDANTSNQDATNQSDLRVDLSTCTNVTLYFRWKEFLDEDNTEDGVFLSDDGGETFVKIHSLTGGVNNTWDYVSLDIDNLASLNGLSLTEECIIRFQQRDNFGATTDGIAIDYVYVYGCNNTPAPMLADVQNDQALGEVRSLFRGSDQYVDDPQPNATSLSQLDKGVALTVFPNPADEQLNIQLESFEANRDLTIEVVNMLGAVQYSSVHTVRDASRDLVQLQVDQLPAGVYTVVVKDQARVLAHQQVVLQR